MTTFIVDNTTYTAETDGKNLLEVCLGLGLDIPYFCWHPAFRSVGACRQCAVKVFKDETDVHGRIEMSCMIPVEEGMRVSIGDPEAVAFRAKVIEWLMVNHPHDCPVCDEGGECHLQDMTVMAGHVYRRHRFAKRTHRDQDLGPFVNMEMNRCIQCYRCVRFYRDYAGGRDFDVMGWHDHVYFGRHEEGPLQSEFSGNLVEVCPTGVFTDKSLKKHYTRKWDLQTAPSVCMHCGLGCNTIPGERYGTLRRISPRFNGQVNGYFLCDRGRYGYEFVNGERRIRQPLIREAGRLTPSTREQALARGADLLRTGKVIGIGSPRASLESNFALRALVGAERFFHGMTDTDLLLARSMINILRTGPTPTPPLHEVESCDAVLVLGEDVTNTAPMLDLALRQSVLRRPKLEAMKLGIYEWLDECLREAIQDDRGPLYMATPGETKLDPLAAQILRAAPNDIARLGFAVAHELDPSAPAVPDLTSESASLAETIARGLRNGKRPLVVSGPSCRSAAIIEAAANVAWALSRAGLDARLCFVAPECNTLGAALIPGAGLDSAVTQLKANAADTVVILENDIPRRLDPDSAQTILRARHVVVLDHLTHDAAECAELVLPAAAFPEAAGTVVNNEGRAQRFFQVFAPAGPIEASWRWAGELMAARGKSPSNLFPDLDAVLAAIIIELPMLAGIGNSAPPAGFRMMGRRIPRQPSRYSGRTAMTADMDVHEPKPPYDSDSPLSFTMEGSRREPPSPLIPRFWAPQWNSAQAINKFQMEIGGPLRHGDPGQRLIEPEPSASASYFAKIPARFAPRPDEWLFLPAYHVYGSEECSAAAGGVAQRSPQPYVGVGYADAQRLGITEGREIAVTIGGRVHRWPAALQPSIPAGTAVLPIGLPGLPALNLPARGKLAPLNGEHTP